MARSFITMSPGEERNVRSWDEGIKVYNKIQGNSFQSRLNAAKMNNRIKMYYENRALTVRESYEPSQLVIKDASIRNVFILFITILALFYVFFLDNVATTPFESGLNLANVLGDYGVDMKDSLVGSVGPLRNYINSMNVPTEDASFGSGIINFFEGLGLPFVLIYAIFRLIITFALGNIKLLLGVLSILLGV